MFKWIGLIVGAIVAAQYFSLLPNETIEHVPSMDVVAEQLEQITVGDVVATVSAGVEQGQEIINGVVEQLNEQQISETISAEYEAQNGDATFQESFENEVIRQFTFWSPFSSRYSANGMAQSLTHSTGILVDVINQGNEYLLSVSYGSENEKQLLINKLNAALGSEVLK